jgi:hypothetical protein
MEDHVMSVMQLPGVIRTSDLFSHIDMGFLNRRLAISALGPLRDVFVERQKPGSDHMTVLGNDHLLVTMLIDVCTEIKAPTLAGAMAIGMPRILFMSTERLTPCPDIYDKRRVSHQVYFDVELEKPVYISYHTEHLVSSTGKMTLFEGHEAGYLESIIGLLEDRGEYWKIEPIVIGAPWLDHPRNDGAGSDHLMWFGKDYGEILPEDIEQFSRLSDVNVGSAAEWMDAMKIVPESKVKELFAKLLNEPTKKDWGGEENDHFSANVLVGGRRHTAAFLLKGPTNFQEMTIAMCGKNGDQIYRLTNSGADISTVQHSHLVGAAVRSTLRSMVVTPGRPRKFCIIDGQTSYRIFRAYGCL